MWLEITRYLYATNEISLKKCTTTNCRGVVEREFQESCASSNSIVFNAFQGC